VFGSATTGAFRPDTSDLDFVARFDRTREPDYAERFYLFAEALQDLFGRPVDLLTEGMIRNPFFREDVERTRQTVVELSDEPSSQRPGWTPDGTTLTGGVVSGWFTHTPAPR
jgi:predicted nucleotidyltransferase